MVEIDENELDTFMRSSLESAMGQLEDSGETSLVIFVRPRNSSTLLENTDLPPDAPPPMAAIPYQGGSERTWFNVVGAFVQEFGAQFCVMISEAWWAEKWGKAPGPNYKVRNDPNRKECIAIQGIQYDVSGFITREVTFMQPFERDDDHIVYLDLQTMTSEDGECRSTLADVTARQDLL